MRQDQALRMTKVISRVVAVGVLLYVPVLLEDTEDVTSGLMFLTLLMTGLMAGMPVLVSAVMHGWAGRVDGWTPVVASSAAVVAAILLVTKGGRPGSLVPTSLVLVAIYAAMGFVGVWLARRASGGEAPGGLSAGR